MKAEKTEEADIAQEASASIGEKENKEAVSEENAEQIKETDELTKLQDELAESKDKYLRLYSEFENFRRRTSKEKLDLIQTANQDLMGALIPILDDFERAEKSFDEKEADTASLKDGISLIQQKLIKVLEQKGLTPMENKIGMDFDPEFHEAITQIPAPKKKLKGKVVDVIEKGYMLREKVVRYAKVVTGN